MKNEHSALHNVIDINKWQKLQDSLALVTKMALITVDYKGTPVTDHSSCCDFCRQVREDPQFLSYCKKCDSRGGLEAVRTNKPYIYYCHFDIIDVAIPIIIDDKYIGAVMAGQVKLPSDDCVNDLEHMQNISKPEQAKEKLRLLQAEYDAIPSLSLDQIKTISDMLYHLCNYIIEEALEKQFTIDMYMNTLNSRPAIKQTGTITGYGVENIKKLKKEMSNTIIDAYVSESMDKYHTLTIPLLKPAFEYIYQHKNENISLKTMAEVCHISTSYFSRIFFKETGENFTNYLTKLKINWSKELLEATDMPVNQISDTLGFSEPGYFIKKFKIITGITPSVYRKILHKS